MHVLYELNDISFTKLLETDNNSKTYINNNLWKYHYVLTYLLHKRRYTTLKDGWVKVSVKKLKRVLGNSKMKGKNRWFIDRIRQDFKRWNIILTKYKKNVYDNGITKTAMAKIKDERIATGWQEWTPNKEINLRQFDQPLTGVYANMQRSLSRLTIDYSQAIAFAQHAFDTSMKLPDKLEGWRVNRDRFVNWDVFTSWKSSIKQIQQGHFEIHVQYATSGRAFTPVTNFSKFLKHTLRMDGKPMLQFDCSCSQPLIFAALLKSTYKELTDDMRLYIDLTQSGQFYPHFQYLLRNAGIAFNEASFKADFFSKVFYTREKRWCDWRKIFHKHFEGVSNAILKEKKAVLGQKHINDNGNVVVTGGYPELLSNKLSLLESEIIIQGVAKSLYGANIYDFLTVHDAILVTEEYADVVYDLMLREYQNCGVTPTIKREALVRETI